ncbi:MAG: hypothetical protein HPZ91_09570 [Lentisphaeria bacterium]|nr:hypothetical protein [Lentisphaeria bacterium]
MNISTDKLQLSPEMLREVLAWRNLPETEVHVRLSMIFHDAEQYRCFHRRRHEKALVRSIRWGAEYDAFLQKHLAAGLSQKIAKTIAKRDFIAAHPLTADGDDYPGHSNPAIKRYHQAYLQSLPATPME